MLYQIPKEFHFENTASYWFGAIYVKVRVVSVCGKNLTKSTRRQVVKLSTNTGALMLAHYILSIIACTLLCSCFFTDVQSCDDFIVIFIFIPKCFKEHGLADHYLRLKYFVFQCYPYFNYHGLNPLPWIVSWIKYVTLSAKRFFRTYYRTFVVISKRSEIQ